MELNEAIVAMVEIKRRLDAYDAMLEALREIEAGLRDTGSTRGQWMTRITKPYAWKLASDAIELAEKTLST